jgi:Na+/H+-dicarboxylate symporter
MYRTAVNIFSDSCGAAIIARSEGEEGVDTQVRHAPPPPTMSPVERPDVVGVR